LGLDSKIYSAPQCLTVYDCKWKSHSDTKILKKAVNDTKWDALADLPLLLEGKAGIFKFALRTVLRPAIKGVISYFPHFLDAIKQAKLTGRLLAICLALGYPFSTQTISMMGFSLGTQVIKSCLSMLDKLGAYDIINNVTLLAGASHYDKNHLKWEKIFNNVVGGEIKNCFSNGDSVLK